MRIKLPLTLLVIAASPCVIAQTAVTGSLADFGRDTAGGQSASSWGLPSGGQTTGGQSSAGQAGTQASAGQRGAGQQGQASGGQSGPGQTSGQTSGGQSGPGQPTPQSSNQNGSNQNNSQNGSNQNSSQNGNQNGQGSAQGEGPPSGQNGAAGQEDGSKGEPNLPDEGDGGRSQDPKGEPNLPDEDGDGGRTDNNNDGDNGDGGDGGKGGRTGNNNNGDNGDGQDGEYKPLDDGDPQYDPTGNEGENEIPSGCAEANSTCAQCVRDAEENIQFNRRYLHIAWSISHSTLDYANKRIAFGDTVSGIHGAMALSWQLAGKPQIEEAMESLRKTYGKKYKDYIKNIEGSLQKMADCEAENYSIRDLYQRFGFLYLEFVKSRYESPD
jgi:hypothetical protein